MQHGSHEWLKRDRPDRYSAEGAKALQHAALSAACASGGAAGAAATTAAILAERGAGTGPDDRDSHCSRRPAGRPEKADRYEARVEAECGDARSFSAAADDIPSDS